MEDELLNSQGVGLYSFLSFTNLTPLYAGLADRDRAKLVIDKYLSSKDHFLSDWGIRSLSKSSEFYNNAIWGNPPRFECPDRLTNSNWQGPVWVLCTYFMFHALLNYGYTSVAREAIDNLNKTLAADITNNGMMNENYDAENGRPLYASNFGSWNVLADLMPEELKTGKSVCDVFMK
jgi:glycogen debranching enzyme